MDQPPPPPVELTPEMRQYHHDQLLENPLFREALWQLYTEKNMFDAVVDGDLSHMGIGGVVMQQQALGQRRQARAIYNYLRNELRSPHLSTTNNHGTTDTRGSSPSTDWAS